MSLETALTLLVVLIVALLAAAFVALGRFYLVRPERVRRWTVSLNHPLFAVPVVGGWWRQFVEVGTNIVLIRISGIVFIVLGVVVVLLALMVILAFLRMTLDPPRGVF